jgi:hypothetical protein
MDDLSIVIFSKDRAMQLDLCIRSLCIYGRILLKDINILYNASNEKHEESYEILKKKYEQTNFILSDNFQKDLVNIIKNKKYVFFVVDDCVFVSYFSLEKIMESLNLVPEALGFSLRLGNNITYCYPVNNVQKIPDNEEIIHGILKFKWMGSDLDFGYPLEVSSSVYRVEDLMVLLNGLCYENPNELEYGLDRYKDFFVVNKPYLLCQKISPAFCNPINKINNNNFNRSGNNPEYSIENLADLFLSEKIIYAKPFLGFISNAPHQEVELQFIQGRQDESAE